MEEKKLPPQSGTAAEQTDREAVIREVTQAADPEATPAQEQPAGQRALRAQEQSAGQEALRAQEQPAGQGAVTDMGQKRGHRKLWVALLIVLLVAGTCAAIWWECPVSKVYVQGNSYYTSEEIAEQVIRSDNPLYHNSVFLWARYLLPGPTIPFEESVRVGLIDPQTVLIKVKDKPLAGYIPYGGRNLYFDASGIVQESSPLTVRGVTYIKGLDISEAERGHRIGSPETAALDQLLDALQTLRKYEISADSILVDDAGSITLYFDEIKVMIGRSDYELKISKIAQIISYLQGRSGTIDMTNYSSADENIILR